MGIGGISRQGGGGQPLRERVEVDVRHTPVSRGDLRGAIGRAYQKVTGKSASSAVLDALTAHASLETASGAQMYNYNFGGIKGASSLGETAKMRTKEVYDGHEVHIRDGFRAYRSLDEGAIDYVKLMNGQFRGAVHRAEAGDLTGFAHALKEAHYYTADESAYASALHRLAGAPSPTTSLAVPSVESNHVSALTNRSLGGGGRPSGLGGLPDSVELDRVLSAISHHPVTVEEQDPDSDE